jgi:hypothetical protein
MSFDKLKAMRSAERFLTQGKITDAIKEYTSLVENDAKDFNTMNNITVNKVLLRKLLQFITKLPV